MAIVRSVVEGARARCAPTSFPKPDASPAASSCGGEDGQSPHPSILDSTANVASSLERDSFLMRELHTEQRVKERQGSVGGGVEVMVQQRMLETAETNMMARRLWVHPTRQRRKRVESLRGWGRGTGEGGGGYYASIGLQVQIPPGSSE